MSTDSATPPVWVEVRVLVPVGWHELVAEAIVRGPCSTVAFGGTSAGTDSPPDGQDYVRTFVLEAEDSPELRAELALALKQLAQRAAIPELEDLVLEFHLLTPEDYATSWRKTWKPFRVGRLCIVPPEEQHPFRPADVPLRLEPGGAFGTGRHATTRNCLRVIQDRIRPGERVLDAGSGNGVLSVASTLLGARSALGFDLDPVAATYAELLADQNGVRDRCTFRTGDIESIDDAEGPFDAVLANIYSDIIREYAPRLHRLLRPGGWFAFSGCPVHHRDATAAAIGAAGFRLERERVRGRWHTFEGIRP